MFYALATGKITTDDREYVHELADIESLNQRAMKGELDVTAVSIHAYAYLADRYALLPNGSSMGDRYGPCVVGTTPAPADVSSAVAGKRIAIPGTLTTAALTLRLFAPDVVPVVIPFDEIDAAVKRGDVDAGVLIHEGQLTYAADGLHRWVDLGEWWYGETGLPLPLGGNAVRRDLGDNLIRAISHDLRASIVYGLAHREEALRHAMQYARGLDDDDADRFVGMYVNDYTVDYGDTGRRAVHELLSRGHQAGIISVTPDISFVADAVAR